jgi:tRNA uridine 5-carbamoylmethylation protein Kti12
MFPNKRKENMTPKVIIMVGNVGSGKTTWIREYLLDPENIDTAAVSKDDIRKMLDAGGYLWDESVEVLIEEWSKRMICDLLNQGKSVIVDETNMSVGSRFLILQCIEENVDAPVAAEAIVMPLLSKEESVERKSRPDTSYGYESQIWEEIWQRKHEKFIMPTKHEGFQEIIHVK